MSFFDEKTMEALDVCKDSFSQPSFFTEPNAKRQNLIDTEFYDFSIDCV